MTYKDAVQLLGQDDSAFVSALDQALGLGLLAVTAFSPASALPYFELKNELISQLRTLVSKLKERLGKAGRIEYEQLLNAAHAVIVVTAYSEALAEQVKKLDGGDKLTRELRQWKPGTSTRRIPDGFDRWQFVEWADRSMIRPPGPVRSLEDVIEELDRVYAALGQDALEYLRVLRAFQELRPLQREEIGSLLSTQLPRLAISRYRGLLVRLAAEIPEFMTWLRLNDGSATRFMIRSLLASSDADSRAAAQELSQAIDRLHESVAGQRAALGDLPAALEEMIIRTAGGRPSVAQAIADCHRVHELVLDRPLLEPQMAGELQMIQFPACRSGYINPNYRKIVTSSSDEGRLLARDDRWQRETVRSRLGVFLAGYLRSDDATQRPLLVLGDPGSGKSLLTQILAAQLPPAEFAVARVELRHVRSAQDIGDQIDDSLLRQTNKRYRLRDLTDTQGKITRIVIMDGLDELLQLSPQQELGRYLQWLTEFQEVESELGHPVIAIATARTIVMDRIYVPSQTVVIKLEDFTEDQIISWLNVWNRQNAEYFATHGLEHLSPDTIMRQLELARQPLLLALLALYDAENNALRNAQNLSEAGLYERIFHRYLERELDKDNLPERPDEREPLIEQRLRELSTIAIGMLNRGRRFITRQEVTADFNAAGVHRDPAEPSTPTGADDAVGQFFFLYRAQAQHHDAATGEGYEFIHATFGEFLAARIIAKQLARASDVVRDAPQWDRDQTEQHARQLLAPYLARRPLAGEEQVLTYLQDIVGTLVPDRRNAALAIAAHIPALLMSGLPEGMGTDSGRGQLDRLATVTVNLATAALRTARDPLPLSAFCRNGQDPLTQWRRLTALWQAYLALDDWDRVLNSMLLSELPGPNAANSIGSPPEGDADEHAEYELSCQDPATLTWPDLGLRFADTVRRRMIQAGRLNCDHELRGAGSIWAFAANGYIGLTASAAVDRLVAIALFHFGPVSSDTGAIGQALEEIGAESTHDLGDMIGGLVRWASEMLSQVADHLIAIGQDVEDVRYLIPLISELDKRGSVAQARKLLRLIPVHAMIPALPTADIAGIVALSRRHQMPELLSRAATNAWLTEELLNWLSIEDIAWIIQSRSVAPADLTRLREVARTNPGFRRVIDSVTELLAE